MTYEIYKQLLHKAGPRQLKDPQLGLVHCQGGQPGEFNCAPVAILGDKGLKDQGYGKNISPSNGK